MSDMGMKLYTVSDIRDMLHQALCNEGFTAIDEHGRGTFVVVQTSGIVSQSFKITVESTDIDPV
jgi:hypothetical protein